MTFMHFIFTFISHISHGALFLFFYCLCFRSFGSEGMVVINFFISSLSLFTRISFFLLNVLLMPFAAVIYSFQLCFRSCVLLVFLGVGYTYACIGE